VKRARVARAFVIGANCGQIEDGIDRIGNPKAMKPQNNSLEQAAIPFTQASLLWNAVALARLSPLAHSVKRAKPALAIWKDEAMPLRKIRLELARDPEFPLGSNAHGYEFVAPVGEDGHLDPEEWKQHRAQCRARRFWGDEEEAGHLVRKPGGHWAFHYDIHGDADDDEAGYRFGDHRFMAGEYISIREHDDDRLRTFRIVRVEELT
jgi:hypothetical protein